MSGENGNIISITRRTLSKLGNLGSGTAYTIQVKTRYTAHMLEVEDAHFHHDSAVLMPDHGDLAPREDKAADQNRITGIAVLVACYRHARQNPDQRTLVVGHTDRSGSTGYNQTLSELRADNLLFVLRGERGRWVSVADAKNTVEDIQQILRWLTFSRGWNCNPGPKDGKAGPHTRQGVRDFQTEYNTRFGGSITVDGIVGSQTWGAIFDVYEEELTHVLAADGIDLGDARATLNFLSCASIGCGESFPITPDRKDNYESPVDRRVEVLFFDPGDEPDVDCSHPRGACSELYEKKMYSFVPINTKAPPPPEEVTLHITEVAGLYKPGHDDGSKKLSGYQAGYKSEDDLGRIFINHTPRTDPAVDWDDCWKKDAQYIELTVELRPSGAKIPGDARVVWEWEDPDDPSNEDMHEDASVFVDPADYEVEKHLGPTPNDNIGDHDHPSPGSGNGPAFEKIDPYGLDPVSGQDACETKIAGGLSKVRMHCTNAGGDNFKVKVGLKKHPRLIEKAGDETGIMTVWKRIDIEYRKMDGAGDLPVDEIPSRFEKAFVQMDITAPLSTPKRDPMSARDDDVGQESSDYVKAPPVGVFEHEYKPGWFLLVAAHEAAGDVGSTDSKQLYPASGPGPATVLEMTYDDGQKYEGLVLPTNLPTGSKIDFVKLHEGGDHIRISAYDYENDYPSAGECTVFLYPVDYLSDFKPGDGALEGTSGVPGAYDIRLSYYPRHVWSNRSKKWNADGLGFGRDVDVEVFSPGSIATGGISPTNEKGGRDYFAGRTIIFTRHRAYAKGDAQARSKLIRTIVHEFAHAFGFPHKCGYYTWEDPADRGCVMNYYNTWLYELDSGSVYTVQTGDTLSRIAADNGLDDWRAIFDHPRNQALRRKRSVPRNIRSGDRLWIPSPRRVQRFVPGNTGLDLCARHIDGIRRVHLEDNPALWKT